MGVLISIVNGVKKVGRAIKDSKNTIQDTRYAVYLIKEKIKAYFKSILKAILSQILIYAIILVVIISAVSAVFEMFAFWKWGNKDNSFDIDPRDVKEWSESLSEADIKAMQEYGASIHPKKIPLYAEIEDNSYKKNVKILIPVETQVIKNGRAGGVNVSYTPYVYARGDTAYPYRQWWQSVAGLDTLNDTANKEKNIKIIKNAEKELKPIFNWADPMTPDYVENSRYGKTSSMEEISTRTTIETEVHELVSAYTEDGERVTHMYRNDSFEEETETIIITTSPLPFLNWVETMFAKHLFSYKPTREFSDSSGSTPMGYYTVGDVISVDGERKRVDLEYKVTLKTYNSLLIESWEFKNEVKDYLSKFMDFLNKNKIDTRDDPQVMYHMVEMLPQNYDFITQYGEYLDYADATGLGGFRGGYGGSFVGTGDYEMSPSDFIRDIPLFIQTDPRWGNVPYCYYGKASNGTIGTSGCGPTSMAMAIAGLGGYNSSIDLNGDGVIDPYEAAMYSLDKGHRIYGSGTSWAYFNDIGKATGLKVKQVASSGWKEVLDALKKGNPVVASMGPGAFTKGGHYITLVGIDSNGRIIVNDSNSTSRSNQTWSFENIVLPQSKQFWIVSN